MCFLLFFPSVEELERKASLLLLKADYESLEKLSKKIAKYIAKKKHKLDSDKLEKYQNLLDEINATI